VFETTIRYLGGLLGAFALTGDARLRTVAHNIGKVLIRAFKSQDGPLPHVFIQPSTGTTDDWGWLGNCISLGEVGTLDLEFKYLSDITGDSQFREKVGPAFCELLT
jgi:mannosyl-oligosaccharide alpha-1,2-mannosidase